MVPVYILFLIDQKIGPILAIRVFSLQAHVLHPPSALVFCSFPGDVHHIDCAVP
jgi:hypothetical protein